MEGEGGVLREGGFKSSGVTVVGSEAGTEYHVAPRIDVSSGQVSDGSPPEMSPPATGISSSPATGISSSPATGMSTAIVPFMKKRGRPRKYGPGGSLSAPLSANPISSSVPPVIDFSSGKTAKHRGSSSRKMHPKFRLDNIGEWVACSVGSNFTPHIITVNTGEDVTMKVISFSQQGPRAICILSANGMISSVTLRQPDSSGGTLTYEGRFEILSLSGSFMPNDNGGVRGRSGGMSVSLASPDGRILGGGVAGLLVAASPAQVVVGSFLAGNQHERKQQVRKQKAESIAVTQSGAETEDGLFTGREQPPMAAKAHLSSFPSFRGDNWSSVAPVESRSKPAETDMNSCLPEYQV